ncbi:c-type cytochrome [Catenovulum sediminis]|uniref:c-type cytochrome n=1 Tax=Catenovulum sediminis TaxID=1740262 RepID=UPI003CCC4CEC
MGLNNKVKLSGWLLASCIAFVPAVFAADMSDEAIKERIKPIGSVHVAGENASAASAGGARSGEQVYNASCTACHSVGVMGAPKPNVAADWNARIEQGFDTMLDHAINGFNAMPPKGTCMDCSDDEIKAAIEYMISDI